MDELGYRVKTEIFEGPLDLLLDLIEKRKLFVNDLSLSEVTNDFINYIQSNQNSSIGESAEFILIASTLMLVKSRSLLPNLELTEEEESSIDDLENRLQIYARIKELSLHVKSRFGKNIIYSKNPSKETLAFFSPDQTINIENIIQALDGVLISLPKKEIVPKAVVQKIISLEEAIEKLAERVSRGVKMNFNEFYNIKGQNQPKISHENKVMIIVGFLAMLELIKRGAIQVTQEVGGDIEIETGEVSVPHYE